MNVSGVDTVAKRACPVPQIYGEHYGVDDRVGYSREVKVDSH